MLDAGADIRADQDDLLAYALMGASYARNGLDIKRPRVGLLNVGVEEHKGRAELKVAHEMIANAADAGAFDYIGFVEGGDLPSDRVDVIVTDGFTGNVALKTGEGTAIKSHGSADPTGVAAAITLAYRLAQSGFSDKLAARVASAVSLAQDVRDNDVTS